MKALGRTLVFVLVPLVISANARSMTFEEIFEQPEPRQRSILSGTAGRWLWTENFSKLESFADRARQQQIRTSSGVWVLGLIYEGIQDVSKFEKVSTDAQWDELLARSLRWQETDPQSITAKLAHATLLRERAWFYRGDGYAHEVSNSQFARFHEQIAAAKRYLLEHRELARLDPQWYALMLLVLKEQREPADREFAKLLDEAIGDWPDYYPIYFSAAEYFMPKWQGSAEHIEAFARDILEKAPSAVGKMLYARIYWSVAGNQYRDGSLFQESEVRWKDMRAGFEQIIEDYPSAWNINHYAKFACLARDEKTAKKLFDLVDDRYEPQAWSDRRELFEQCSAWLGRQKL